MKNLQILLVAVASMHFASCGGNTESARIPDNFNSASIIANQNHLPKILTKEMVAKIVNVPLDKILVHLENDINQQRQYTMLYSWPTGNTIKVGDEKHTIDEYHSISLGFVKQMDAAAFEKYYGTNEGLQEQVNEMVTQDNFNKEVGSVEATHIADYAKSRKTEKLENIATAAFWETPMNALHVLAKDAAFTISTNFGNNENVAKQKAVEMVNAILNP